MSFESILEKVFYFIASGSCIYITTTLKSLGKSVEDLNIHIATLIERTTSHSKQIEKHDDRLTRLEMSHNKE